MVERTLTASGSKSLVEEVAHKADIHSGELLLGALVLCTLCGDGYTQHLVVQVFEELAVFLECLLCVRNPEIQECLGVADEIYRLSVDCPVRIVAKTIAFIDLSGLSQCV